jgi:hypothetical protein
VRDVEDFEVRLEQAAIVTATGDGGRRLNKPTTGMYIVK